MTAEPLDLMGVALDKVCEDCEGVGIVADSEWEDYWRRYNAAYVEAGDTPGLAASAAQIATEAADPEPEGPEERPCGECEGTGTIPTPEGTAILALVGRHRGGG